VEEKANQEFEVYLVLFLLLAAGLVTIFVATRGDGLHLLEKQFVWMVIGAGCLILLRTFDYRHYANQVIHLYGMGIVLLLSVFLFGKKVNGALSWIDLKVLHIQPSELTKITTLLMLARLYEWNQGHFFKREEIGKAAILVFLPTMLVLMQPDLGMSLIYLSMLGCFLVMSRLSGWMHITYIMVTIIFSFSLFGLYIFSPDLFFRVVRPHQFERLLSFIHPESDPLGSGYQYIQARKVVGSGQLDGMGGMWVQTANGSRLPEQHTDFIFAVIAQQWGFLGASILLLLYFFLFYRLIEWAMRTPDPFASFFISGMVTIWSFQVFVNIGMNIGLSPITGLTLPFISYGGSSLISNLIAFGMIVSMRKPSTLWKLDKI
jgi:rod shape determining protein RodA